jgi:hypothetical protein
MLCSQYVLSPANNENISRAQLAVLAAIIRFAHAKLTSNPSNVPQVLRRLLAAFDESTAVHEQALDAVRALIDPEDSALWESGKDQIMAKLLGSLSDPSSDIRLQALRTIKHFAKVKSAVRCSHTLTHSLTLSMCVCCLIFTNCFHLSCRAKLCRMHQCWFRN